MLSFLIYAVIKLSEKTCQILGFVIFRTSAPDCTTSQTLTYHWLNYFCTECDLLTFVNP